MFQVNFAYKEDNKRKSALVKLRVCENCVAKLGSKYRKRKAQSGGTNNPSPKKHKPTGSMENPAEKRGSTPNNDDGKNECLSHKETNHLDDEIVEDDTIDRFLSEMMP